jgi:hypothetical protein
MPKRTSEEKLAEIRALWRSLPDHERRQFINSAIPRLNDDLLVRILAIVTGQIERRELGSYPTRLTMLILAEALLHDMAIETVISHLNDCLALPTAKVSND